MADVASALKDADTKMSKAVEVAKDAVHTHPCLTRSWLITTAHTQPSHN